MSFVTNLKRVYGVVKQQGPSIFSGIKKGLAISKIILDVSKDVINRLRNVAPETAHRLERITKSPSFEKLDNAITLGNHVANNGIPQITSPQRQVIRRNTLEADQIANNMAFV